MLSKRATHLQMRKLKFREVQSLYNVTQIEYDIELKASALNQHAMEGRKMIGGEW